LLENERVDDLLRGHEVDQAKKDEIYQEAVGPSHQAPRWVVRTTSRWLCSPTSKATSTFCPTTKLAFPFEQMYKE
jgi:hypothetical protein